MSEANSFYRTPVTVITDSTASLPPSLVEKWNIIVIPVHVHIGSAVYREGVDISVPKVLHSMLMGTHVKTSEPSVEEIAKVYQDARNAGSREIVSIHVSGGISKTLANAQEAAKLVDIPVTLVDTRTIALAQGYAALGAAAVARRGGTAEQVAIAAKTVADSSYFCLTVESLEYMRRGGRVSKNVARIATLFKLRPILHMVDGEIAAAKKVRGTAKARAEVARLVEEHAKTLDHPAGGASLIAGIAAEEGLSISISGPMDDAPPGASITVHTGPGTYIAIAANMPPEYV